MCQAKCYTRVVPCRVLFHTHSNAVANGVPKPHTPTKHHSQTPNHDSRQKLTHTFSIPNVFVLSKLSQISLSFLIFKRQDYYKPHMALKPGKLSRRHPIEGTPYIQPKKCKRRPNIFNSLHENIGTVCCFFLLPLFFRFFPPNMMFLRVGFETVQNFELGFGVSGGRRGGER